MTAPMRVHRTGRPPTEMRRGRPVHLAMSVPTMAARASATTQASVELVTNPGFENGFTGGVGNGWTKWTASGSNTITAGQASVNKHSGSYSQYWARSDTAVFDGGVYQRIAVTPGVTYNIGAWMKRQSTIASTARPLS